MGEFLRWLLERGIALETAVRYVREIKRVKRGRKAESKMARAAVSRYREFLAEKKPPPLRT